MICVNQKYKECRFTLSSSFKRSCFHGDFDGKNCPLVLSGEIEQIKTCKDKFIDDCIKEYNKSCTTTSFTLDDDGTKTIYVKWMAEIRDILGDLSNEFLYESKGEKDEM